MIIVLAILAIIAVCLIAAAVDIAAFKVGEALKRRFFPKDPHGRLRRPV